MQERVVEDAGLSEHVSALAIVARLIANPTNTCYFWNDFAPRKGWV